MFHYGIRKRKKGFTLVELLMAIFVFALISGMAFKSVNALSVTKAALDGDESELLSVQKALSVLSSDISGAIELSVADVSNTQSVQKEGVLLFELKSAQSEASLYTFFDGAILRKRLSADPEKQQAPLRLLTDVKNVKFTAVGESVLSVAVPKQEGAGNSAHENWFELVMEHKELGVVRQLLRHTYNTIGHSEMLFGELDSLAANAINNTTGGPQIVNQQSETDANIPDDEKFDW